MAVVPGTGFALYFGTFSAPGTYVVVAINPTTTCSRNMAGAVSLTPAPSPGPITGPSSLCMASTITLGDDTTGGTWGSSNPAVGTVGSSSGIVTAVISGTTTITYTAPSGCTATKLITVVGALAPIAGPTVTCASTNITLTETAPGGSWTSANTAIATVGSATGIVAAVSSGAVTISYAVGTGCSYATTVVTVNAAPSATIGITGSWCSGTVVNLPSSETGVSYQLYHSGTTYGSPVAGTGGALSLGIVPVGSYYTLTATMASTGCTRDISGGGIAIHAVPTVFTLLTPGSTILCSGSTGADLALSGSNVGTSYQLLRGGTPVGYQIAGTGTMLSWGLQTVAGSYSAVATDVATGCASAMTGPVTFISAPEPGPITGPGSVCLGSTITLTDLTAGGVWSSSSPGVATAGSGSGVITGVTTGTVTVTYTGTSGCAVTKAIAVVGLLAPIAGATMVCAQSTTTLTETATGGNWSSSNTAVATVGTASGVVTGVNAGTATLSYTVGTGCSYAILPVTINATPIAIVAPTSACLGGNLVLPTSQTGVSYQLNYAGTPTGSATPGTGSALTWGPLTAVGGYTVVATQTGTSCTRTIPAIGAVSVNAMPVPYTPYFPGSGSFCAAGGWPSVYLSGSEGSVTYTLLKNGATAATRAGTGSAINFGPVPVATGDTFRVRMTTSGGCYITTAALTATMLASPGLITGPSGVCTGATITLSDTTAGGVWSSSSPAIATIGTTGIVTGITTGTATITYTAPSGCTTAVPVTVVNLIPAIAGPGIACTGSTITLTDAATGGVWTSSDMAVAHVGSGTGGIVTGMSAGTATISYAVGGSCGYVTKDLTVNITPAAITGITSVCGGGTTSLADATTGGTWSSSNTAVATVGSTGIVTTIAGGAAIISYGLAGCKATVMLSVDPPPVISGPTMLCVGSAIHLTSSIAGNWSSSNPSIASINTSTGVVTGITPGTVLITCTAISTGCVTTRTITVTSSCMGTPAAGTANAVYADVCGGNADLLYLTGASTTCGIGFQWQSSADGVWWTDVAGATNDSLYAHPTDSTYYRCKASCYSSGLHAYSTPVHVNTYNNITTHSVNEGSPAVCAATQFQVVTCGWETNSNIVTYYGDGTWDSTHVSGYNTAPAHVYSVAGTYTVKQVLRNGTTPQDSVIFFYNYNTCRTLPVFFYFDDNANCTYDGGDALMYRSVTTEVDSNGIPIEYITAINGFYYTALGGPGTIYSFRVTGYDTGLHMACPTTGILNDTITSFMSGYPARYFGFTCAGTTTSIDLSVHGDIQCARHMATGNIYVENSFCTAASPVVKMTFSTRYAFGSSYPAPTSIVGNTVTWVLPPLSVYTLAAHLRTISYTLNVPGAFLTAGDTVQTMYHVDPMTGDINPVNNTYTMVNNIFASFDPNYIEVKPAGVVIPCTPLEYTIHFENVGNDTARNIAVLDTLADNLDIHTLKVTSATAVVNLVKTTYGGHNVVKFDFPHINLADSSHHNQCTGAVTYTIKTKPGLADGTVLMTYASIYFDDNEPVKTDTATNTIGISPIAGPDNVCRGATVLLTDASENGVWSSSNATATVTSGTVHGVAPGIDTIRYTLTNSCGTKAATQVVTVNALVTPGVTMHSGTGMGDTVCAGSIPTFTAMPINGGAMPTYEWDVNGVPAGTGSTLTYVPLTGDMLQVRMTSNATCATPDTATAAMTLEVITPTALVDSMTATPGLMIAPGMADTFVANITSGGPATYEWLVNGVATGDTGNTFITHALADRDSVTCITTATDLCRLSSFNSVIVTVSTVGTPVAPGIGAIIVYPNPNRGDFVIRGSMQGVTNGDITIEITNVLGQTVYTDRTTAAHGAINAAVKLGNGMASGMYVLTLRYGGDSKAYHFILQD